ncbi:hypothetical protein BGZ65_001582 [Modicella reniformis]|uniref:Berberine/berberine-like domain-containing protein n=1 Tax=Modicella reniformis TaxID=1440133 RepID=A0A9P6M9U8_9FUNG|nr:hypothetical protein BGZ65_001582 [Modicella reniformis]
MLPPMHIGVRHTPVVTQKSIAREVTAAIQYLRDITPGSGAYFNEADLNEPNWQHTFFGANYPRLKSIKNQVDPTGMFVCHHCVGNKGYLGNPLAVVVVLDPSLPVPLPEQMARFANWTNLSETTFLLPPTDPAKADYSVRIFTPSTELPFAGHPTLGTCKVFLEHTGTVNSKRKIIQDCGVGLVELVVSEDGSIAFVAPPLSKIGPVEEDKVVIACHAMGIDRNEVLDTQWIVNGPHWFALLVKDVETVMMAKRNPTEQSKHLKFGIIAKYHSDQRRGPLDPLFEVRTFPHAVGVDEDPVTGSFNAGAAQWLIGSGVAPASYIVAQGTAMGRRGRIMVRSEDSDTSKESKDQKDIKVWIGGHSVICIRGTVQIQQNTRSTRENY